MAAVLRQLTGGIPKPVKRRSALRLQFSKWLLKGCMVAPAEPLPKQLEEPKLVKEIGYWVDPTADVLTDRYFAARPAFSIGSKSLQPQGCD